MVMIMESVTHVSFIGVSLWVTLYLLKVHMCGNPMLVGVTKGFKDFCVVLGQAYGCERPCFEVILMRREHTHVRWEILYLWGASCVFLIVLLNFKVDVFIEAYRLNFRVSWELQPPTQSLQWIVESLLLKGTWVIPLTLFLYYLWPEHFISHVSLYLMSIDYRGWTNLPCGQ